MPLLFFGDLDWSFLTVNALGIRNVPREQLRSHQKRTNAGGSRLRLEEAHAFQVCCTAAPRDTIAKRKMSLALRLDVSLAPPPPDERQIA